MDDSGSLKLISLYRKSAQRYDRIAPFYFFAGFRHWAYRKRAIQSLAPNHGDTWWTLNHTSTEWAPWYIVPADNKWFTRTVVADVIIEKLKSLKLSYPVVSDDRRQHLLKAKKLLDNEPS